MNKVIIEKAFSKATEGPKLNLSISWEWPQLNSTLSMLTDTMDVPIDEISEYVYAEYAEELVKSLKEMMCEYLKAVKQ